MISPQQRRLTIALWAVLVLVMAGVIGAGVWTHFRDGRDIADGPPLPVLFDAPAFSLTTQANTALTDQALHGHVYIADFVFTQCAGPCRPMTIKMAELQKAIPNPAVRFVSFSVDPTHDTPGVLTDYAKQFGADYRWSFLTGGQQAIFDVARGMKVTAELRPDGLLHATYFLLVDASGCVRGAYNAQGDSADQRLKQLVDDVAKLVAEQKQSVAATGDRPS
jgi:protein SCO1